MENEIQKIEVDEVMRSAAETIISGDYHAAIIVIMGTDDEGNGYIHTFKHGEDPDVFYLSDHARKIWEPHPPVDGDEG